MATLTFGSSSPYPFYTYGYGVDAYQQGYLASYESQFPHSLSPMQYLQLQHIQQQGNWLHSTPYSYQSRCFHGSMHGMQLEPTYRTGVDPLSSIRLSAWGDLRMEPSMVNASSQIYTSQYPDTYCLTYTSTLPHGPPRRPNQSGFALWVGSLFAGTTITALKDHFSQDATEDIESVLLIPKSHCAFVNYRSEAACTAARQRFHNSRLNGMRIVCRERYNAGSNSRSIEAPAAIPKAPERNSSPPATPGPDEAMVEGLHDRQSEASKNGNHDESPGVPSSKDRYFILKSFSEDDLELSMKTGTWATQSHNEDKLNGAYKTAENVYLIFSANKSGRYAGFARMASHITGRSSSSPKPAPHNEEDKFEYVRPKVVYAPRTGWAPGGWIIEDPARRSIFWEAERQGSDTGDVSDVNDDILFDRGPTHSHDQVRHFRVEWLSTEGLPFRYIHGLRNPWNANREVKVARDGTEIEPGVGKCLVEMFRVPILHKAVPTAPLHFFEASQ